MYNEQARDEGKEMTRANWSKENLYLFCDLCIQYAERSKGKRGATISQRMPWKENIHFKAFQDEGIESELEHKMEQLFGVSVAQGIHKFTPVMDCSQHASVGYNQYECVDEMTGENITFTCGETNEKWQEIWNDSSPRSSPIRSPQSNEHETFERRGSKRTNESDVLGSRKSAKVDSIRKIGGAALLTEKLDIMVEAITQRNKRDMELMKLEVHGDSSHSLADSLAKLVSMPNLIPGSPEFCFACTLIEDPQKRTILRGIPDDISRLQWIKYLFDKQ
ncbi:hypothetical protein V6N13_135010 [Hibiscus sabdariffa]|uniref:Myb/SANT-like domain-containing protein n=1 Tax=Hibiscus sabdariffa TaxID=183260 RepID=A0ABR2R5G5_9ROSI